MYVRTTCAVVDLEKNFKPAHWSIWKKSISRECPLAGRQQKSVASARQLGAYVVADLEKYF